MLNENFDNGNKKTIKMYLIFLILTVALIFLFLALFSVLSVIFNIDKTMASLFSVLSLCFGTLVGSYLSGKTFGSKALFVGGVNGLLLYIIVSIVAAVLSGGKLTLSSLFNFLIILLSSVIGAVFGVNAANKRKIK